MHRRENPKLRPFALQAEWLPCMLHFKGPFQHSHGWSASRQDQHHCRPPASTSNSYMELEGIFYSLSMCWELRPCLGFSANSDHWRKNISVLAKSHRVYAIDLIGYGYSDKPSPGEVGGSLYTFETWASQLNDFCSSVVKDRAFFICNSIGGLVGLQAAVANPEICRGLFLLNISLRMLHVKKQPWFGRPFIASFQSLLRNTAVGKAFFRSVATQESVRSILCQVRASDLGPTTKISSHKLDVSMDILRHSYWLIIASGVAFQCYHDTSQVTDELVQIILHPGNPMQLMFFLSSYATRCPVLIAWGDKDPWESIELGRAYGNFDTVEDFVVLPNVGHCPQDEAPHLVNPLVESFVACHSKSPASASATI
ncbi:hypothetical protein F3Y22_tig00111542pilonHSYRG00121 [Hibiscus syriacus]|uniref:AB hydrolase-1 domain-containing protein n=1 Tax=Hibiscus syriacus TaxID=106335 RepID=A0A6A2YK37_HIBSY|nr:hypothetical protein F3Y22_tig00111542pilonHSYRG00121 [Hibiscus syriacus]